MLTLISISLGFKFKLWDFKGNRSDTLLRCMKRHKFPMKSEFELYRLRSPKWELNVGSELMILAIFVSTLLLEKNSRPLEPSVLSACVARADTQPLSPLRWDCLTQAVHTKNSCTVCLTHTHTCVETHMFSLPFFFKFSWASAQLQQASDEPYLPQRGPGGLQ